MNITIKRKIYATLEQWTPPWLFPRLTSSLALLDDFFSKNKIDTLTNKALKDSKSGDAFILATGPSLKEQDLSFLYGKDCYSVSNFFLHEKIKNVAPKMHFFTPYHEPLVLAEFISWMRKADKSLPETTAIVLGDSMVKMVTENNLFPNRNLHYLKLRKGAYPEQPNLCRPILSPYTSPLMILPVLFYMGYERVFLLGCDHNTLKDYGKTIENFYDPSKDVRSNATNGKKWDQGIIYTLQEAINVCKQYEYYSELYSTSGKKIYNMSPTSWLDFIPFISIEEYEKHTIKISN
jgi:hypothetical protein